MRLVENKSGDVPLGLIVDRSISGYLRKIVNDTTGFRVKVFVPSDELCLSERYKRIAQRIDVPYNRVLVVSSNPDRIDAADEAGLKAIGVVNHPVGEAEAFKRGAKQFGYAPQVLVPTRRDLSGDLFKFLADDYIRIKNPIIWQVLYL